jgi:putative DNA primase/helicase
MARVNSPALWLRRYRGLGYGPCNEGRAPIGNVIIFNAEDGAEDTIVPRLMAADADMERVHIVSAVMQTDGKGRRTFNLQADLALLERKIVEIGDVALVIIDPISSYLGKTDSHKNSEVRGTLEPLSELADRLKVAILSITHFSKSGAGNTSKALHRFIGSIAFVGAPRAAFAVIEDADQPGRMLVLHAKNNIALKPQGLAYRLVQTLVSDDIMASYVHWEDEPVTISADEALGAAESTRGDRSAREEAEEFLRELLAGGPIPQKEIKAAAEGAGVAWATIRRAKDRLGILPRKAGMDGGWAWELPKVLKSPEDAQPRDVSTFGKDEHLRTPSQPDYPDLPRFLDRRANGHDDGRCDHCGQPGTAADPLSPWNCSGRPEGVRLHARCEEPWSDSK